MSFVIFDTEYTSWKGCLEHGWVGNQKKEIVQINAAQALEIFLFLENKTKGIMYKNILQVQSGRS